MSSLLYCTRIIFKYYIHQLLNILCMTDKAFPVVNKAGWILRLLSKIAPASIQYPWWYNCCDTELTRDATSCSWSNWHTSSWGQWSSEENKVRESSWWDLIDKYWSRCWYSGVLIVMCTWRHWINSSSIVWSLASSYSNNIHDKNKSISYSW